MFFYAEDDVLHYDNDADLNTPRYSELIHSLVGIASTLLSGRGKAEPRNNPVFIDIGSGTGACSLPLLVRNPDLRLVAVDICPPMHEVFRAKAIELLGKESALQRIRFVEGDIATEDVREELKAAIRDFSGCGKAAFSVSGLALHHLTLEEKRELYDSVCDLLTEDGFYLNADLFGYRDPGLNKMAQEHTLVWIKKQHDSSTTQFPDALRRLGPDAASIACKWIEHCELYNVLLPLDHDPESPGDLDLLTEAGFSSAECCYRWWQTAIVLADRTIQ